MGKILDYVNALEEFFTSRFGEDIPVDVVIEQNGDKKIANIIITGDDDEFVNVSQLNVIVVPQSTIANPNGIDDTTSELTNRFDELRTLLSEDLDVY